MPPPFTTTRAAAALLGLQPAPVLAVHTESLGEAHRPWYDGGSRSGKWTDTECECHEPINKPYYYELLSKFADYHSHSKRHSRKNPNIPGPDNMVHRPVFRFCGVLLKRAHIVQQPFFSILVFYLSVHTCCIDRFLFYFGDLFKPVRYIIR